MIPLDRLPLNATIPNINIMELNVQKLTIYEGNLPILIIIIIDKKPKTNWGKYLTIKLLSALCGRKASKRISHSNH